LFLASSDISVKLFIFLKLIMVLGIAFIIISTSRNAEHTNHGNGNNKVFHFVRPLVGWQSC